MGIRRIESKGRNQIHRSNHEMGKNKSDHHSKHQNRNDGDKATGERQFEQNTAETDPTAGEKPTPPLGVIDLYPDLPPEDGTEKDKYGPKNV